MKYIISIIYSIFIIDQMSAQDLIRNGNFEGGIRTGDCLTDVTRDYKPFRGLEFWDLAWESPNTCNLPGTCPTADWLDVDACSHPTNTPDSLFWSDKTIPSGYHGRFCGIYDDGNAYNEKVRIGLTNALDSTKMYQLRIRVAAGNSYALHKGIRIIANFTKFGEHWNASTAGSNVKWEDIAKNVSTLTIQPNSPHKWYDLYFEFKPNNEDVSGGIVADLENLVLWAECGDRKENCYVLIDDVHLYEIDLCGSICTPDTLKKPIFFAAKDNGTLKQGFLPNSIDVKQLKPLNILVANANDILFEIYASDGSCSYTYHIWDANGIKDTGFSDFVIRYGGEDRLGGILSYPKVYLGHLRLSNCQSSGNGNQAANFFENWWDITVVSGTQLDIPRMRNGTLQNCCVDSIEVQNTTYSSDATESANYLIESGTTGKVIVQPFVKVKYGAGEEIRLGGKFKVEDLGEFKATIQPCQSAKALSPIKANPARLIEDLNTSGFTISPNPSSDLISLKFDNRMGDIANVKIYDLKGQKLYEDNIRMDINVIEVSHLARGMYIIVVESGGKQYKNKLILQ